MSTMNANPEQELDSFVAAFTAGIDAEAPAPESDEQPGAQPQPQDGANQPDDNATDGSQESPTPDAKTQTQQKQPDGKGTPPPATEKPDPDKIREVFDKSDKVFAEMRVELKENNEMFVEVAKAAGLPHSNAKEARQAVLSNMRSILAQKQGVNTDILNRMQEQEKAIANYKADQEKAQLKQEFNNGIENLVKTFRLNQEQLIAFGHQMKDAGIDPISGRVDVMKEYKALNFDSLIAQAEARGREAGRQEELQRRAKAQTHSTTPLTRQGGANDTGESINSTDALRAFLEKN